MTAENDRSPGGEGPEAAKNQNDDTQASTPWRRDEDPRRRFLERFGFGKRSGVMNAFLRAVRQGASTPGAVLEAVRRELVRRGSHGGADPELVAALVADSERALFFASHCLDRERLPKAERDRQKSARSEAHRRAWMADQPATLKQLRYLSLLGHAGPAPANRAIAARLIDALQAASGRGAR